MDSQMVARDRQACDFGQRNITDIGGRMRRETIEKLVAAANEAVAQADRLKIPFSFGATCGALRIIAATAKRELAEPEPPADREALREWLRHKDGCPGEMPSDRCTCG